MTVFSGYGKQEQTLFLHTPEEYTLMLYSIIIATRKMVPIKKRASSFPIIAGHPA